MLIETHATLVTSWLRSGTSVLITMSGTLDAGGGAMAAAYLLDLADVADGDLHLDLRAVDPVDGADRVLVTVLHRRLAVRGHQLQLTAGTSSFDAPPPPPPAPGSAGRPPRRRADQPRTRARPRRHTPTCAWDSRQ
jgi:hypothetical protein